MLENNVRCHFSERGGGVAVIWGLCTYLAEYSKL